jgi:hypothetical protein
MAVLEVEVRAALAHRVDHLTPAWRFISATRAPADPPAGTTAVHGKPGRGTTLSPGGVGGGVGMGHR